MHTRIDHSGMNMMLDILCGKKRKFFRYYYIYQMDKDSIMLQMGIDEKEFTQFLKNVQYHIRRNLIYKQCEQCHKYYYTPRENSTICDTCKSENDDVKKEKNISKAKRNVNPTNIKSIYEILRCMEAYNEKHNTNLSYGYYVYLTGE